MSDEARAIKIDAGSVARCHLPPLTASLVEEMAHAAYVQMMESCRAESNAVLAEWGASDDLRKDWHMAVKAMYRVLAIKAGARPEGVAPLKGGLDP